MASRIPGRALSKSAGNEGSRGSRGLANRGAQPGESTNEGADAQLPDEGKQDLRDADARGGGGAGSASSRSKDTEPR
jgi:hypothetical protein